VDITHSRSAALAQSRERLARALAHLERLTREATEVISHLNREKKELLDRVKELERLMEQERANAEQRARLHSSAMEEANERQTLIEELRSQHTQAQTYAADLEGRLLELEERNASSVAAHGTKEEELRAKEQEITHLKELLIQSEEKLSKLTGERDELKSMVYEQERENAQWTIRLTREEQKTAISAIDKLIEQVSKIEQNLVATNGEQRSSEHKSDEQMTSDQIPSNSTGLEQTPAESNG